MGIMGAVRQKGLPALVLIPVHWRARIGSANLGKFCSWTHNLLFIIE
jgi:hypothetical protein